MQLYFGPKSGPTKNMVWILNVHHSIGIPERIFRTDFENYQQTTKHHKKLPSIQ